MYNKGKQFDTQFFKYEPKCKQKCIYFGGPEGVFNYQTGPILLSSYPQTIYICTCQIRKQSDMKLLSLSPKYDKNIIFVHIWGVLGGPYVEPRSTKIAGQ